MDVTTNMTSAARRDVQNALSIASIASQQSNLTVKLGEHWCFNWADRVIEIPQHDLLTKPWEHNVWVVLHEAAHVAITRYHLLTANHHKSRNDILFLLNAIEDIRIERWIIDRFPGSANWQKIAYADAGDRSCSPASISNPANAFIESVYLHGQNLPLPKGLHPIGLAAAGTVKDAVNRTANARPTGGIINTNHVREQLKGLSPLSSVEKAKFEFAACHSHLDRVALLSQLEAWRIVQREILPVYHRLVEEHGQPSIPQNFVPSSGIAARPSYRRIIGKTDARGRLHIQALSSAEKEQHSYNEIVARHSRSIDQIAEVLIEKMRLNRSLECVRNLPYGDRVHMPAALQFAADRRKYTSLWVRRTRPTAPEPAFLFAIDVSGSMRHEKRSNHCLESMIVMREVCLRTGIPHAIIAFNAQPIPVIDWNTPDSPASQEAILSIASPNGATNLNAALDRCVESIEARRERDRHVWVLTDADISSDDADTAKRVVDQMILNGINIHGLGFGSQCQQLRCIIPAAAIEVEPESLRETIQTFILNAVVKAA